MNPTRLSRITTPPSPRLRENSALSSHRESGDTSRQWIKNQQTASQLGSLTNAVRSHQEAINNLRRRGGSQDSPSSEFPWQTPYKELDPSVAVKKNTFVCISPQNPIATVGLIDLVLPGSQPLLATPGIWQALCDVPKKTSGGAYNMPQDPVPTSGVAATSGSPLKGDLDGTADPYKVYWLLWKSTC